MDPLWIKAKDVLEELAAMPGIGAADAQRILFEAVAHGDIKHRARVEIFVCDDTNDNVLAGDVEAAYSEVPLDVIRQPTLRADWKRGVFHWERSLQLPSKRQITEVWSASGMEFDWAGVRRLIKPKPVKPKKATSNPRQRGGQPKWPGLEAAVARNLSSTATLAKIKSEIKAKAASYGPAHVSERALNRMAVRVKQQLSKRP